MRFLIIVSALILSALTVTACGMQGDLYLPEEKAGSASEKEK